MAGVFRPTAYMEKVSRFLETHGQQSLRGIRDGIGGSTTHKDSAAEVLAAEGFVRVEAGARNARLFTSVAPYREVDDPHSDRFSGGQRDDRA